MLLTPEQFRAFYTDLFSALLNTHADRGEVLLSLGKRSMVTDAFRHEGVPSGRFRDANDQQLECVALWAEQIWPYEVRRIERWPRPSLKAYLSSLRKAASAVQTLRENNGSSTEHTQASADASKSTTAQSAEQTALERYSAELSDLQATHQELLGANALIQRRLSSLKKAYNDAEVAAKFLTQQIHRANTGIAYFTQRLADEQMAQRIGEPPGEYVPCYAVADMRSALPPTVAANIIAQAKAILGEKAG